MQGSTLIIRCPACKSDIPLTETLAQPLIDAERERTQKELQERVSVLQGREEQLARSREELTELQKALDSKSSDIEIIIQQTLQSERKALEEAAEKKVSQVYAVKLSNTEQELALKQARLAKAEETELKARREREELENDRRNLELTVNRRVDEERQKLRQDVAVEERERWSAQLADRDQELAEKSAKLQQAEEAERAVRKERQALEDQKRTLELEVERRIDDERTKIREATQKQEQENNTLKMAEKDKVIEEMRKQVEELRRKSHQGSQQLQGEVLEDEVERLLADAFPGDIFELVAIGRPGADLIHSVITSGGLHCGKILWESKNTKNWSQDWLAKNRQDQRNAHAHVGVIVTSALPKGIDSFSFIDGVWVANRRCAVPLAYALRQTLLETARVQAATKVNDSRKELLYTYLTSKEFRQRIAGLVEIYLGMRKDFESEKLTLSRLWSKRDKHLNGLMAQTSGIYGDLQGIVGKSMPEIDGLNVPLIEGTSDEEPAKASASTGEAVPSTGQ